MPKPDLDSKKTVLITGAGSGIGRAVAQQVAATDVNLALLDINQNALNETAQLTDVVNQPIAISVDIAQHSNLKQAVTQVVDKFGRLDAVCHCAAQQQFGRIEDISIEEFQRILDVNLVSAFALTKYVVPELLNTAGSLVHIASLAGNIGLPYVAAYSASKAGLIMMVKSLAKELADRDIRINAIAPGAVDTPMLKTKHPDNINPAVLGVIPRSAKQPASPQEIANLASYLMFEAPASLTGSIIDLAGAAN